MRHLTLLSLFFLLCLGVVAGATDRARVAVASSGLETGLDSLQVEKLTLLPLPEAPLIAAEAADSCSNATQITLTSSGVGETTVVNPMTEGAEDPVLSCAWGSPSRPQGYRTVWYKFIPSSNGRVTIDTSNNFNSKSYDTILAVHTGTCGATTLTTVACNDDYQGFASRVTFNVAKDVTYFVEVADWNGAEPGTLELDIFFVLNPIQSKWESLPTSAPARTHHATVKANGLIYMVGGQTNASGTPELGSSSGLFRYNPATDSWATLPEMPIVALTDVTAAYVDGRIFVPGGYDGNSMVGTHNVYSIGAGVWEPVRVPPPVAVGWAQAVVPEDEGGYYLVGGISNTDFFMNTAVVHNDVSFFNGQNWNTGVPDMAVPRYGHTAVWINDGICVVGGIDDNNQLLPDGECYQPAGSGTWLPSIPPMNIARYGAGSAVSPDGRWFVFGGQDFSNTAVPEVEVYDPDNPGDGWQIMDITYDLGGSFIRARAFPEGQFIGNHLYAVGGHDTTDFFVTPLVQRLLTLGETVQLPIALKGGTNPFNDNFGVAQRLTLNAAQIHQFNDSFDFFDAFFFDQPNTGVAVTVRLSQIPSGSDYNITIYDQSKAVRGSSTLAGNQAEAVTLLLPAGRYYVMVERIFGQSDGSNYRLIVEQ